MSRVEGPGLRPKIRNAVRARRGGGYHVGAKEIRKGKKRTGAINLRVSAWIVAVRVAVIKSAQLAALVEIPPVD